MSWQTQFDKRVKYEASYSMKTGLRRLRNGDSLIYTPTHTVRSEPLFSTLTNTVKYKQTLPTQCDGVPRVTVTSESITTTVISESNSYFYSVRSDMPPTPSFPGPRMFDTFVQEPGPLPHCSIPKEDCPHQWREFKSFLKTYKPEFGNLEWAWSFYKDKLDGIFKMWNRTSEGESYTGSIFLDSMVHNSHDQGHNSGIFFENCDEAQNDFKLDCLAYSRNRNLTEWLPKNYTTLHSQELDDALKEAVGCTLFTDQAILHYFPPEEFKNSTSRDICANDGWGQSLRPSSILQSAKPSTTIVTAITFPAHRAGELLITSSQYMRLISGSNRSACRGIDSHWLVGLHFTISIYGYKRCDCSLWMCLASRYH
jgi:hypothetical protein